MMSFQISMTFFILQNTLQDILKNVNQTTLAPIDSIVWTQNRSHTFLKYIRKKNLGELSL